MTATIYDVASQAGVSIATVSRVLNVPHSVNSSTRARVQAASSLTTISQSLKMLGTQAVELLLAAMANSRRDSA